MMAATLAEATFVYVHEITHLPTVFENLWRLAFFECDRKMAATPGVRLQHLDPHRVCAWRTGIAKSCQRGGAGRQS